MTIQGENIILRTIVPEDLNLILQWENDKNNWKVSETTRPFTTKEIEDLINSHHDIYLEKQLRLMICLRAEDNKVIGIIDLFDFNIQLKEASIGILIGEYTYRKKGFASEALSMLINYSFSKLNLNTIYCNIQPENMASLKLFQNQNFKIVNKKENRYLKEKNITYSTT